MNSYFHLFTNSPSITLEIVFSLLLPRFFTWIVSRQVLVGEPSVIDTIQILRGLKDKYESHHGVRIHDRCV